MGNFKGMLSICLLIVTVIVAARGERNLEAIAQSNQNQQLPWGNVFNNNSPPVEDRPGGRRGDICIITPRDTKRGIWSARPLFVWKGQLSRIQVRPANSDRVLWEQKVKATDSSSLYQGEALQAGKSYNWMLFDTTSDESSYPTVGVTFRVMDEEERSRISADIAAMESQLKSKRATEEQIAYEKAKYFGEKQLTADALQEVYRVKNPSVGLSQFRESLSEQMCK